MDPSTLQHIALEIADARALDQVLGGLVQRLAREPGVALARVWLLGEGDQCESCPLAEECHAREQCLHLVASAGRSRVDPEREWLRLDGRFRRFPLGVRKVGRIGASGEPLRLCIFANEGGWLVDPQWAAEEGLHLFAGQPLVYRGETMGVLALFVRRDLSDEEFGWLRTFADQAAVAIANARAFEELSSLRRQLELENDYLREQERDVRGPAGLVGESAPMRQLLERVRAVAPTEATVLIEGESGTGKELVAAALHEHSERADRPLVRVNCAAVPPELFESEFFGHQAGAFTGAARERAGRFQVAHRGTLFLDEVGEIPLALQGKLLRVLQEGAYSRVGEDEERAADVRVIAATNRDLRQEVESGRFREDLYYRLTVFPLRVPALRERREDVPLLAEHFLRRYARKPRPGRRTPRFDEQQLASLSAYDWPGNVRELSNVVERALIDARHGRPVLPLLEAKASAAPQAAAAQRKLYTMAELDALQRDNLIAVLDRARWKIAGPGGAAEFLGLHPATLTSRLKALGIERPRRTAR